MDVQLSSDALAVIDEKVASGEFPSPEAVIDEALRLLSARDREYGEWLRAAAAKGEESAAAKGSILVDEAFRESVRARVREHPASAAKQQTLVEYLLSAPRGEPEIPLDRGPDVPA